MNLVEVNMGKTIKIYRVESDLFGGRSHGFYANKSEAEEHLVELRAKIQQDNPDYWAWISETLETQKNADYLLNH
jgi:hypothetical protein